MRLATTAVRAVLFALALASVPVSAVAAPDRRPPPGGRFDCGDGQAVSQEWVNDGQLDCRNGADERSSDQFDCGNGQAVLKIFVNDGVPDCRNGADERGSNSEP